MLSAAQGGSQTRLGVLGWPVAHSRSPAIQNAALHAAGLDGWRYQLLPVPPDTVSEVIPALFPAGFRGANVTVPHKGIALELATDPSPRARAIGAANTLVFGPEGAITADNTDAPGLIAALPGSVRGREALVLGAGGSARAAVWALLDAGAHVRVWNRTAERAAALCRELGGEAISAPSAADLLVNCTTIGLDGGPSLDELPFDRGRLADFGLVVDLVYGAEPTGLIRSAQAAGVSTVEGLEILVEQGALSFESFTGRPAPRAVMRAAAGLDL